MSSIREFLSTMRGSLSTMRGLVTSIRETIKNNYDHWVRSSLKDDTCLSFKKRHMECGTFHVSFFIYYGA